MGVLQHRVSLLRIPGQQGAEDPGHLLAPDQAPLRAPVAILPGGGVHCREAGFQVRVDFIQQPVKGRVPGAAPGTEPLRQAAEGGCGFRQVLLFTALGQVGAQDADLDGGQLPHIAFSGRDRDGFGCRDSRAFRNEIGFGRAAQRAFPVRRQFSPGDFFFLLIIYIAADGTDIPHSGPPFTGMHNRLPDRDTGLRRNRYSQVCSRYL